MVISDEQHIRQEQAKETAKLVIDYIEWINLNTKNLKIKDLLDKTRIKFNVE